MTRPSISGAAALAWLMVAGMAGACGAHSGVKQPEAGAPTATKEFSSAADLLAALEDADKGLRRLRAEVEFTKIFQPDGDVHRRIGDLYFASDPPPAGAKEGVQEHRRFAVNFDKFFRDDRLEEDPQSYAFDGLWLMEKHPKEKKFTLRQVVRPGENFDPLKIGQGPFPIPIGQKKDDIVAEYDASLLASDDGLTLDDPAAASDEERERADVLVKSVQGCWQIRLVPKAGQEKEPEFSEVRLWYFRDKTGRLLPRMARTVKAVLEAGMQGDIALVRLINVKVNDEADIKEAVFDVQRPEGWDGTVDELPKDDRAAGPQGDR